MLTSAYVQVQHGPAQGRNPRVQPSRRHASSCVAAWHQPWQASARPLPLQPGRQAWPRSMAILACPQPPSSSLPLASSMAPNGVNSGMGVQRSPPPPPPPPQAPSPQTSVHGDPGMSPPTILLSASPFTSSGREPSHKSMRCSMGMPGCSSLQLTAL